MKYMIEYVMWGPLYRGDRKTVQSVWARAINLTKGNDILATNLYQRILDLPSLEYKRIRGDDK